MNCCRENNSQRSHVTRLVRDIAGIGKSRPSIEKLPHYNRPTTVLQNHRAMHRKGRNAMLRHLDVSHALTFTGCLLFSRSVSVHVLPNIHRSYYQSLPLQLNQGNPLTTYARKEMKNSPPALRVPSHAVLYLLWVVGVHFKAVLGGVCGSTCNSTQVELDSGGLAKNAQDGDGDGDGNGDGHGDDIG